MNKINFIHKALNDSRLPKGFTVKETQITFKLDKLEKKEVNFFSQENVWGALLCLTDTQYKKSGPLNSLEF